MPIECSVTPASLDWKPGRAGVLSAWMGLWELTVRPRRAGGWEFHVVNPIGDWLSGHRLTQERAIADCHELAERLAGKE